MQTTQNLNLWYKDYCIDKKSIIQRLKGIIIKQLNIPINDCIDCENPIAMVIFIDKNDSIQEIIKYQLLTARTRRIKTLVIFLGEEKLARNAEWELYKNCITYVLDYNNTQNADNTIIAYLSKWILINKTINSDLVHENLIGNSDIWLSTLEKIIEVSFFSDSPIMIMGESGTGKELVARLIHTLDTRKNKGEIVVLDCASTVPELSGSEFFGHEKGAFTNAIAARDGVFALANKGTLFLDEIGELPLRLQGELLRVLQEKTFKKIGSNIWNKTDFRLVSATNRNIPDEVDKGCFRHDLYFRISTFVIVLPSLNDRKEDIPILAEHFLKKYKKMDFCPNFSDSVLNYLLMRNYKGNIRELEHLVNRIAIRHEGCCPITLGNLPESERPFTVIEQPPWETSSFQLALQQAIYQGKSLKEIKEKTGNMAIEIAIDNENGNIRKAAEILQISDRTIQLYKATKNQ